MNCRPVVILETGEPLPAVARTRGRFPLWFTDALALAPDDVRTVDARTASLPDAADCRGVIVTGSPAMVTSGEPWIETAAGWLREAVAAGRAILGVCFGHQLLAHALGGTVGSNPHGREIGTATVHRTAAGESDPLFHGLPAAFPAHLTHEECVHRLPPGAARLGVTERDPNAAFALAGHRVWGVQFHPEFDTGIMRGYVEGREDKLAGEGLDPAAILERIQPTPAARSVLHRFKAVL